MRQQDIGIEALANLYHNDYKRYLQYQAGKQPMANNPFHSALGGLMGNSTLGAQMANNNFAAQSQAWQLRQLDSGPQGPMDAAQHRDYLTALAHQKAKQPKPESKPVPKVTERETEFFRHLHEQHAAFEKSHQDFAEALAARPK